jgi:iron complex outermembrane receptor protein
VDGGDFYQTQPYDTMLNRGHLLATAFYIQDDWRLLPGRLSLLAGLRYDRNRFFKGYYYTSSPWNTEYPSLDDQTWHALSPRLTLLYTPAGPFALSLNYSRGFRTAVLDDLTRTGFIQIGPKYANPALQPESIDNFEAGLKFSRDSSLVFKLNVYFSKGSEFHYYLNTGDTIFGRPVYRKENLNRVRISGLELSLDYTLLKGLKLNAGYTLNHSVIRKNDKRPALQGRFLTYVPKHQVKAGVTYRSGIISGSLMARYKSHQYTLDDNAEKDRWGNRAVIQEYMILDASLWSHWRFLVFKLSATNLTNRQYLDNILYLAPGRMVNASIGVTF